MKTFGLIKLRTPSLKNVHFSSETEEYATPQSLFNELDEVFHFTLDACASAENAKCEKYFTKADDSLRQIWSGTVWMNPPYGRKIIHFMRKAYEAHHNGATVVCLVPARTDTKWWHKYAVHGTVIFLRGRLCFNNKNSAPFPSAIIIFWKGLLRKGYST